ncbi:MAG: alpha/beta fold hydrolase [Proteobacteria bacterium]|nr:alpha/beta fold hydrolase [Pseudomonadota bacterium]
MRAVLATVWLVACSGGTPPVEEVPTGGVVTLTTRDGVQLEADLYAAEAGAPAVVLLHMTPACCDRTDWPASFIDRLGEQGWAVLVPDRRGSGASGGVGEEAYLGDLGRNDVEAAVAKLAEDYGPIAVIGASNGTTSMIDYASWAPGEGLVEPAILGFMTGGTYTENQTAMGDWLTSTPAFFTFSTDERDWSITQQERKSAAWTFFEYPTGDHGTRMFTAAPTVTLDMVEQLRAVLDA